MFLLCILFFKKFLFLWSQRVFHGFSKVIFPPYSLRNSSVGFLFTVSGVHVNKMMFFTYYMLGTLSRGSERSASIVLVPACAMGQVLRGSFYTAVCVWGAFGVFPASGITNNECPVRPRPRTQESWSSQGAAARTSCHLFPHQQGPLVAQAQTDGQAWRPDFPHGEE